MNAIAPKIDDIEMPEIWADTTRRAEVGAELLFGPNSTRWQLDASLPQGGRWVPRTPAKTKAA